MRIRETSIGAGGTSQGYSSSIGPVLGRTIALTASADQSQRPLLSGAVAAAVGCDRACSFTATVTAAGLGPWVGSASTSSAGTTVISVAVPDSAKASLRAALASGNPLAATITVHASAVGSLSPADKVVSTSLFEPLTAPSVVTSPTISGDRTVGSKVTATAGVWTSGAITRSWERCTTAATGCTAIAGQAGLTYELNVDDIGKWIRLKETSTNRVASTTATTQSLGPVSLPPAPVAQTAPSVSGAGLVGVPITSLPGVWSSGSVTRHWERCSTSLTGCNAISGATEVSYTPTAADIGVYLRVRETAINAGGSTDLASSAIGPVALPPAPQSLEIPVISGARIEGRRLTVRAGRWSSGSVTRSWQRCRSQSGGCSSIAGATGTSHTLTSTDRGLWIRVSEAAVNAGGSSVHYSAALGPVLKKRR